MNRFFAYVFLFGIVVSALPSLMQGRSGEESISKTTKPARIESETISLAETSSAVRLKSDARGHYVADFKMNGKTVKALVDTGATMVAINKSTARRLGITVTPADFIYEVNTANGKAKVAPAVIREIQIGRVKVRDVEAAVLEDKALDGTLLGMTFLKRLESFSVTDGDLILKQ